MKKLVFLVLVVSALAVCNYGRFSLICVVLFWLAFAAFVALCLLCKHSPGRRPAFGSINRVALRSVALNTAETSASAAPEDTPAASDSQCDGSASEAIRLYGAALWQEQQQNGGQADLRLLFAGSLMQAARTAFTANRFAEALKLATVAAAVQARHFPVPADFNPHQIAVIAG